MKNMTDIQKVHEVLNQYIEGTYTANIALLKGAFHEKATMAGFLGEELILATPEPFFEDMASEASMKELGTDYKAEILSLNVVEGIANAVVFETGFRGNATLEDHFHLIKENGEWKIISKTFTTL